MSYQNAGPTKINDMGRTYEDIQRRKTNRSLLYTAIGIVSVLVMAVMIFVLHGHMQDLSQPDVESDEVATNADMANPDVVGLDYLNRNTDPSVVHTGCETTVLLMRHCEKDGPEILDANGNDHCSYQGLERAHFLKTLFGNTTSSRWPVPSALFALAAKRSTNLNFREIETLQPLAQEYGLEIHAEFDSNKGLAKQLFKYIGGTNGNMCGKLLVVSWRHEMIGDLGRLMSCLNCPVHYPINTFDQVWQLKFVYDAMGTRVITDNFNATAQRRHLSESHSDDSHRSLKKKKKYAVTGKTWTMYSFVTHQNFDPLSFSFASGDYGNVAGNVGGKWYPNTYQEL